MKQTIFLFLFIFSSGLYGQHADTLTLFALENQSLFWRLVSRYYPLSPALIEQYQEDLNFNDLSANENLAWDDELIKKYAHRWNYSGIQRNTGIQWTEKRIEHYMNESWFNWKEISFKRKIYLSKVFYEKNKPFIKQTNVFVPEDSSDQVYLFFDWPYHTNSPALFADYIKVQEPYGESTPVNFQEELSAFLNDSIKHIPAAFLITHKEKINWNLMSDCTLFPWSFSSLNALFPYLSRDNLKFNYGIYKGLIAPGLTDKKLAHIYSIMDPPDAIRFFTIDGGYYDDFFGFTPEVFLKPGASKSIELNESPDISNFDLRDFIGKKFSIGNKYGGPIRFTDFHEFYDSYFVNARVVSEKFKTVLEQFNLPEHAFYPIQLELTSYWYGNDTANYFLFLIDNAEVKKHIDFRTIKMCNTNSLLKETLVPGDSLYYEIQDLAAYELFKDSISWIDKYQDIDIKELSIRSEFDLIHLGAGKLLVSANLKKALEKANLYGFSFTKDRECRIRMRGLESDEKRQKAAGILEKILSAPNPLMLQKAVLNFYSACKKRDSILATPNKVIKIYETTGSAGNADSKETLLRSKEKEWDVVIPESYRKSLLNNQFASFKKAFGEYEFYRTEKLRSIEETAYSFAPMTAKGLLIAENGLGDYLALLLKADSTHELDSVIYKLEHETGEIIPAFRLK